MASDICTEERNTTMNQDKFDDEYLRSVQEGLEKMLEELLKEEKSTTHRLGAETP